MVLAGGVRVMRLSPIFRRSSVGGKLPHMNSIHPIRRSLPAFCVGQLCVALAMGCTPPTRQDLETVQALSDLGESFNDVRQVQQALQDQVDSLQTVVARQDSVLRTLSNLAGVQYPR
jgi:hypothetical protein